MRLYSVQTERKKKNNKTLISTSSHNVLCFARNNFILVKTTLAYQHIMPFDLRMLYKKKLFYSASICVKNTKTFTPNMDIEETH